MTKEDAKDYIRDWCPYDKRDEIIEALEQKPTAIPQQPTLSVEDLISWAKERGINIQVVKSDNPDTFEKIFGELCEDERVLSEQRKCDTCKHYGVLSLDCGRCDDECSQYEPQQRTGHWIEHPKGIYSHLICDKCLSNAPYDCKTNYCPNCGVKMESEE